MKVKILSRGTEIDTEKCVKNVGGNRFDLVLIAAARSRELAHRHKAAEDVTQLNAPVRALLDVQSGLVGKEYLRKV
jgi:DNA-directed RNA polymerase subunit K/omega